MGKRRGGEGTGQKSIEIEYTSLSFLLFVLFYNKSIGLEVSIIIINGNHLPILHSRNTLLLNLLIFGLIVRDDCCEVCGTIACGHIHG